MKRMISAAVFAVSFAATAWAADPVALATITKADIGKNVKVSATIVTFDQPRSERAPYSMSIRDAAGTTMRTAIWRDTYADVAGKEGLAANAKIEFDAEVAEFREKLELHIKDAASVKVAGGAPAAKPVAPAAAAAPAAGKPAAAPAAASADGKVTIGAITSEMVGKTVEFTATLRSLRLPRTETAPYMISAGDESGTIDVVFWKDTYDGLKETQRPERDEQMLIKGEVGEYRGKLQIKIVDPAGLQTPRSQPDAFKKGAAAAPAAPQASVTAAKEVNVAEALKSDVGTFVKVSAEVTKVERLTAGQRVTVKDDSGAGVVLLWDTATGVKTEAIALTPSTKITIAGRIATTSQGPVLVVEKDSEVLDVKAN